MNSKRMYFVLLGLVGLFLVGLVGGTLGVNKLLQAKSKELVNLKLQSQVVASQQISLVNAKKQVAKYAPLEQIAKTVVPQDKDQAEAVLEITKLAKESGISQLTSVTFPQSTLGGPAGTTQTTTPAPAANSSKNALTQLTPVKGISGVYQLQITIQQSSDNAIGYNQFITFLSKLEQNRRTAQVSSITLLPDSKNPSLVAFTLVINEFIKP